MTRNRMRAVAGACATLLALGLTGAAQAAPRASDTEPVITYEKGQVVECTAQLERYGSVYVSLYSNSVYGNHTQVVVGGDEPEYAGAAQPARLFQHGSIRTVVPLSPVDGRVESAGSAVVHGRYAPVGEPTPYRDEVDDAGYHIVTTGTHQEISTRLTVRVLGEKAPLRCDNALAYDLKSTRTPVV
ncbi:hypothetical protein ACPF8X_13250 [Streptomyces sp. G35A]